jgi:hypothetical protein
LADFGATMAEIFAADRPENWQQFLKVQAA